MTIGYERVSAIGQSLEVQLDELKNCDKVFQEMRSGKQTDNRPELLKALDYIRDGDSLVISRLDRMVRSVLDLAKFAERLKEKGVALKVLDHNIWQALPKRASVVLTCTNQKIQKHISSRKMHGIANGPLLQQANFDKAQ